MVVMYVENCTEMVSIEPKYQSQVYDLYQCIRTWEIKGKRKMYLLGVL